jgi:hypothetical protein
MTIHADGSITPETAHITQAGNVYTLTGNISGSLTVEKFGITLDGAGDTPYVIDANNQDHHPLMTPVGAPHVSPSPSPQKAEPQQELPPAAVVAAVSGASIIILGVTLLWHSKKRVLLMCCFSG